MTDATGTLEADEVFRKIGRNLLLFQQAELLIKRLVALDSLSYRSGESRESFDQRSSIHHNMTMGQIAALFLERLCGDNPPASPPGTDGQSGLSLRFSIRLGNGTQLDERRASIETLVEQRNQFVHHLFPKYASAGPGDLKLLADELDAQSVQIREEVNRLKQDLESVRSSLDAVMAFAASPEGAAELFGHEIRNSPLIRNLAEIANQSEAPEGWISLRDAIRQIEDFPSEKIREHYTQFGQKSLSALLTASGLFETRQADSTPDYHGRTVFRPVRRGSPGRMAPTTHQNQEPAASTGIDTPRP